MSSQWQRELNKFVIAVDAVQSDDLDMEAIDHDPLTLHAHDNNKAIPLVERQGSPTVPQLRFPTDHAQFLEWQQDDLDLQELFGILQNPKAMLCQKKLAQDFVLDDGVLYQTIASTKQTPSRMQLVIPKRLMPHIMCHVMRHVYVSQSPIY